MSANEISSRISNRSIKNRHVSDDADIERAKLEQRVLAEFNIPLHNARIWDARHTLLGNTAGTDDLELHTGTFGIDQPTIRSGNVKAATTTRRCAFMLQLPPDYEDGEDVKMRLRAGMLTTISDTTATIDVEAHLVDENGGVGSDLVTTVAQSINSLTEADKDFELDETDLEAGSMLDVRVTIEVVDAATATDVIARLIALKVLCDLR